jgi:hypothetical protein
MDLGSELTSDASITPEITPRDTQNLRGEVESDPDVSPGSESPEASGTAEENLKEYLDTPRSLWLEELGTLKVTPEEAANIFDVVMSTGKYLETYRVGKTVVKIRTRTTVDADRTIEILQEQRPESAAVYSHLVSRVNLASSLVEYGESKFPHTAPSEDNRERLDSEWRERYRFCAALPAPAFYALSQILQKFDEKVSLSCDARSLENF